MLCNCVAIFDLHIIIHCMQMSLCPPFSLLAHSSWSFGFLCVIRFGLCWVPLFIFPSSVFPHSSHTHTRILVSQKQSFINSFYLPTISVVFKLLFFFLFWLRDLLNVTNRGKTCKGTNHGVATALTKAMDDLEKGPHYS